LSCAPKPSRQILLKSISTTLANAVIFYFSLVTENDF
jgi:hypothetical protein